MAERDPLDDILTQPDRPVAPDPAFARRLRQRLEAELGPGAATGGDRPTMSQPMTPTMTMPTPGRLARRRRQRGWMPALEIAAVLLLMLGAAAAYVAVNRPGDGNVAAPPSQLTATAMANVPRGTPVADVGPAAMAGGDAGRTNTQPGPGPGTADEVAVRWTLPAAGHPGGEQVVVLGDRLYRVVADAASSAAGGLGTALEAIDTTDGTRRWSTPLDIFGSPAVTGSRVYAYVHLLGSEPAVLTLVALDAATGAEVWRATLGDPGGAFGSTPASPVVAGGTVYATDPDGTAYAFDAATGAERWVSTAARSDDPRSEATGFDEAYAGASGTFAVADGNLYVVNASGEVYALDAETGEERWHFDPQERYRIAANSILPLAADGVVVLKIGGSDPNSRTFANPVTVVALVSAETGDGFWFQEFPPVTGGFALVDGAVVIPALGTEESLNAGEGGTLVAFDLSEARARWEQPIGPGTYPWVSVADGLLYVGRDDGIVQILDSATGEERWRLDPAASARGTLREDQAGRIQEDRGGFNHLAVAGGQVYALGENGIVYAIGAADGTSPPATPPATPPAG